ncbi:hypothetical protein BATDEDRAFT_20611 [Batrachochytrium dendrobatidis JAM81]|uniref:Probable cytosolic iron-sulfur protein assembly protein 1 n=2 Tax=Batrachochytrium dendrobatidis TaxID=109871 RepID=F4PAK2_BATDJ|nr:uncharacterized protein BATDEDRAFT_20611 [Batrachochytrium dendrobatidis JAM81]EGF77700.1 hypothetical protein BATDEDRAFT_20611 [Batrachochytrium dendrobatidis JAM81]KAJ8323543.1 Cytosolic iron-sulfur protein assembly protein [Batrachochytrium dendrobatidis]KAK5666133.1 Cytosolic iron-sulfur protein assembly protein [Batrachochytrium dendrobatidis]OAJ43309.1 hypothetical protein BDEG_26677 [Batrachochytrium dendrobatidis JEL423]|eukprot:XP_006681620.1 hypothetical protein BATDEDRAFT_20611 [Batrachochytrium dendrobatidis JAM81]
MAPRLVSVAELHGHIDRVWQISWSPVVLALISASGDKSIRVWKPASESDKSNWTCSTVVDDAHSRTVRSVAYNPDGRVFASGSFDGTVGIWERDNSKEMECVASLEGHENEVKCVAWSASGVLLATCSRDKSVWIWEVVGDDEYECSCVLQEHTQDIKAVRWHPFEEILASASYDDTVKIWKEEDADWYCSDTLTGHTSTVWNIDFNQSGDMIASVSDDKSLRVWKQDPMTKKYQPYITSLNHHDRTIYSVSWSKHHGLIATASGDNTICVSSIQPKNNINQDMDPKHPDLCDATIVKLTTLVNAHGLNDINSVVWCPIEGFQNYLASAGDDGIVRIWEYMDA